MLQEFNSFNIISILQETNKKLNIFEAKWDDEKKLLRSNLEEAENRLTQSELRRLSLEGDIERLVHAVADKETENASVLNRLENVSRRLQDMEEKEHALQGNISRLNMALEKSEGEVNNQKDKVR